MDRNRLNSWVLFVHFAAAALGLAGCGAAAVPAAQDVGAAVDATADLAVADAPSVADVAADPLAGTWTFSGHVPAIVTITLTLKSDKTFALSEDVAPPTSPAGYVPTACTTTHSLSGTYTTTSAGGADTLDWTVTGGFANTISKCDGGSGNSPGTPMTPEGVAAYTAQGLFPAMPSAYTVTATQLALTAGGKTMTFGR